MANKEHLKLLLSGIEGWNDWRNRNARLKPLLTKAELDGADLKYANLSDADLSQANLASSYLNAANLQNADLSKANLRSAYLYKANLTGADLSEANLLSADLTETTLRRVKLIHAHLVDTNFNNATIEDSSIYGISAWNVHLAGTTQSNLMISPLHEPAITVDNLKLAQFIYLILNNAEICDVINTTTSKAVLILGRFEPPERKDVLLAIRDKLRELNYVPIIFDFQRPADRDVTETVRILGGLSFCVVADLTNPKSIPLELQALVPDFAIPYVEVHHENEQPFSMSLDLKHYYWVVKPPMSYKSVDDLMGGFELGVVERARAKHEELQRKKAEDQQAEPSVPASAFYKKYEG